MLREYHAAVGEKIIKYSGTLERYAGDGVMVVFNDPVLVENPELQAVLMALETREAIGALTSKWRRFGHDIGFGIGIAQLMQKVFNELDAQYNERGEPAVNKRLADKSIAGPIVLGRCHQHPTGTIYEEALGAYRSMRALSVPLSSEPAKLPPPSEGNPRFRNQ